MWNIDNRNFYLSRLWRRTTDAWDGIFMRQTLTESMLEKSAKNSLFWLRLFQGCWNLENDFVLSSNNRACPDKGALTIETLCQQIKNSLSGGLQSKNQFKGRLMYLINHVVSSFCFITYSGPQRSIVDKIACKSSNIYFCTSYAKCWFRGFSRWATTQHTRVITSFRCPF